MMHGSTKLKFNVLKLTYESFKRIFHILQAGKRVTNSQKLKKILPNKMPSFVPEFRRYVLSPSSG
jgi:hypothetical protein